MLLLFEKTSQCTEITILTYMYVYVCVHVYVYICVCMCMYVCVCIYVYVCMYICINSKNEGPSFSLDTWYYPSYSRVAQYALLQMSLVMPFLRKTCISCSPAALWTRPALPRERPSPAEQELCIPWCSLCTLDEHVLKMIIHILPKPQLPAQNRVCL